MNMNPFAMIENPARAGLKQPLAILLVRAVHGLITLFFLSCIGTVYYAGITHQASVWAFLAAAFLVLEGSIVTFNHGNCPLGAIHHKVGDDKTFFEIFLPERLAKRAVPVLGVVAAIGIILLLR
jgi:hypothetical protein